jgi:hypothetical protein
MPTRGRYAQIDTTTANGRLAFGIFAAFAEFERELIAERTMVGLAAARARGRMRGAWSSSSTPSRPRSAVCSRRSGREPCAGTPGRDACRRIADLIATGFLADSCGGWPAWHGHPVFRAGRCVRPADHARPTPSQ